MTKRTTVLKKTISMYEEWQIVDAVSRELNLSGTSITIRHIVSEYAKMRKQVGRPVPVSQPAKEK